MNRDIICPHCKKYTEAIQSIWAHHWWIFNGKCANCREYISINKNKNEIEETERKYKSLELLDIYKKYNKLNKRSK